MIYTSEPLGRISMFVISTSFGDIFVRKDGRPYDPSALPEPYKDVVQFDMRRLESMCNANHIPMRDKWNILAVGYWTDRGYEHPLADYDDSGLMRHIWNGRIDPEETFFYEEA